MSRIVWIVILALLFLVPLQAQEDSCTGVVDMANVSCDVFDSQSACYGAGQVSAIQDCVEPADFSSPGDVIGLQGICSMHVGTCLSPSEWGLAVLHLAIDESDAVVTMILSGDVDIQNAASAREIHTLHITEDVVALSGPGMQFDEMANLSAGDTVNVDACNCTGNWLRILLDDGQSAWIPARYIEEQDELADLPTRDVSSPVYATMQALRLSAGADEGDCVKNGILIQMPGMSEPYPMEINGLRLELNGATVFIQETGNLALSLLVLDGMLRVKVNETWTQLSGGMQGIVHTDDEMQSLTVSTFTSDVADGIPLSLLPETIELETILDNPVPQIISIPECRVLSDQSDTCQLDFVNSDGDEIVTVNVEFIGAAEGDWTGSEHPMPDVVLGDAISGTLAVPQTCSVGSAGVIIGPVEWSVTITDAEGNISEPYTAYSYCVVESATHP